MASEFVSYVGRLISVRSVVQLYPGPYSNGYPAWCLMPSGVILYWSRPHFSVVSQAKNPILGKNARKDHGHEVVQRRSILLDLHPQHRPFERVEQKLGKGAGFTVA
jgi:hypothetical protein